MKKKITILLWILVFILTVLIFIYQRLTGPSHPVKSTEYINGKVINYKFLRSFIEFENMPVEVTASDKSVTAYMYYKRYKTKDKWIEVRMKREGETLKAFIPGQPAAGKMEYSIRVKLDDEDKILNKGKSVVARFRGEVPSFILILHIVFMFLGILFALRTGMEALRREGNYFWMVNWTLAIVFIGGLILGPIVQKYAFGDLWTGFPFGFDLTDTKTLVAFIFWIIAFLLKKRSKFWVILATVVMIGIYLIPHSVMGSELNYETGRMNNKYGFIPHNPSAQHQFCKPG